MNFWANLGVLGQASRQGLAGLGVIGLWSCARSAYAEVSEARPAVREAIVAERLVQRSASCVRVVVR